MRNTLGKSVAAAALAMALLAPGVAFAVEATAFEKAELAQLTPKLRSEVEARLTGGQTVRGILETILLNEISLQFASGRVVAADFEKGVVVVDGTNGQPKAFHFDVTTLVLEP